MLLTGNQIRDLPIRPKMAYPQVGGVYSSANDRAFDQVPPGDSRYPAALARVDLAPKSLWVNGRLPASNQRVFAIVGARAATGAGCERAKALAADLGRAGVSVVSGGAFGIDAAAHEGSLAVGAATYAVLGCGIDVVYPDRHAKLFLRIAAAGGLISEYPPGTPPRPGQFPARNRVIAGLAEAVIVVEAASRSGALITARRAYDFGRTVLAVPGSPGTDALLGRGHALPVESAADALRAASGEPMSARPRETACAHEVLIAAIGDGARTPAELCTHLRFSLPTILAMLAEAELDGCVRRAAGNIYEVNRRAC